IGPREDPRVKPFEPSSKSLASAASYSGTRPFPRRRFCSNIPTMERACCSPTRGSRIENAEGSVQSKLSMEESAWPTPADATRSTLSLSNTRRPTNKFSIPTRRDVELFHSIMDGNHCLRGFSNRDIRQQLAATPHLQHCPPNSTQASAKVSRIFRFLH